LTSKIESVIVGVDGSTYSDRALEWSIVFAAAFRAEVLAVHAAGLLAHVEGGPLVPSQSHLGELRREFEEEWCLPLAKTRVPHRMLLVDGPPVMALLDTARREDAGLIVMGRSGAGNRSDLLLGSTSHQLAERSHCPVVIVPPDELAVPTPRA
jgi:nucleotide-binding universal stress UspA family protein